MWGLVSSGLQHKQKIFYEFKCICTLLNPNSEDPFVNQLELTQRVSIIIRPNTKTLVEILNIKY